MKELVIVTGGSRGIGAAVSHRLAADEYAIAVNYTADAAAAAAVVHAITSAGAPRRRSRGMLPTLSP